MKVSQKEKEFLVKALKQWEAENHLSAEKAEELQKSLIKKPFNWQSLAYYSFLFALISLLIAVISIFADKQLLDLIDSLISTSYLTKSVTFLLLGAMFFWLDYRYVRTKTRKKYSREIFAFFGAIFLAIATGFLSFLFNMEERPGAFIFSLSIVYFLIAFYRNKELLWFFGLVALMIGYGAVTYNLSKDYALFWGMNFPMRYALLGLIILGLSYFLSQTKTLKSFVQPTYFSGLIIFFISLWLLSITGNYSSYTEWLEIRQYQLWFYSLALLLASLAAIIIGIKKEDVMLKNTGISFIFINLYTRYFEYFWDEMHKALFFTIIAVSFYLIGKKAEKIWDKGD